MCKIISIANQKGGVGKSTTTVILADILTSLGYKVLVIDLDAQCNSTYTYNALNNDLNIYTLLKGNAIEPTIQRHRGVDIIPSSPLLSSANMEFNSKGKERLLKDAIEPILKHYDYILIDTSPEINILTINALIASTSVIIPMLPTSYAMQGLKTLYENIQSVQRINTDLKIEGLLLTRYNPRTIISRDLREVIEKMALQMGTKVFKTYVHEGIAIQESQTNQESLLAYAPKAQVTQDYLMLAKELLADGKTI